MRISSSPSRVRSSPLFVRYRSDDGQKFAVFWNTFRLSIIVAIIVFAMNRMDTPVAYDILGTSTSEIPDWSAHNNNAGLRTTQWQSELVRSALASPFEASEGEESVTVKPSFQYYGFAESEYEEIVATRSKRFPGVDDRVKVYMSNWYVPPCQENSMGFIHYDFSENGTAIIREIPAKGEFEKAEIRDFMMDTNATGKLIFFAEEAPLSTCDSEYCYDTVSSILPSLKRVNEKQGASGNVPVPPLLLHFGDSQWSRAALHENSRHINLNPHPHESEEAGSQAYGPNIPVIKKVRRVISRKHLYKMTSKHICVSGARTVDSSLVSWRQRMEPIIWKLKTLRHYGNIQIVLEEDIPWSKKRNAAIFRGGLTGIYRSGLQIRTVYQKSSDKKICELITRCKLVYENKGSKLIDAKLTISQTENTQNPNDTRNRLPEEVNGVQLYGPKMEVKDLLKYKILIVIEGNDVSSGLKWALFSNSVVLMPPPTMTSWAMEELLQPWVHYVPLAEDVHDVEEKVKWVLENDAEAQRIARNGKLWIYDMLFHPDADKDEQDVYDDIIRRYQAHFIYERDLVGKPKTI